LPTAISQSPFINTIFAISIKALSTIPDPPNAKRQMVGLGRLELPTPRLSSVCSNQLSYRPIPLLGQKANKQSTELAVIVFLKKEKRSRRHFAIPSGCIEAAPWRISFSMVT
jgi:hypothetical protein